MIRQRRQRGQTRDGERQGLGGCGRLIKMDDHNHVIERQREADGTSNKIARKTTSEEEPCQQTDAKKAGSNSPDSVGSRGTRDGEGGRGAAGGGGWAFVVSLMLAFNMCRRARWSTSTKSPSRCPMLAMHRLPDCDLRLHKTGAFASSIPLEAARWRMSSSTHHDVGKGCVGC